MTQLRPFTLSNGLGINKPKIFAFFSGAGFLDLGFELSGYSIQFVNGLHPPFLRAYQHSREILGLPVPKFGYSSLSITQFVEDEAEHERLAKMVATAKSDGEPVGFIGGPPCPDFSVGGKNRGRHGEHGKLSASNVDLICEQKQDFFLFENVKGLWRTKLHRAFYEELKCKLHLAGYRTAEKLINSINFGVPQDSERIQTGRNMEWMDAGEMVKCLNQKLGGWANYFKLGPVTKAYRSLDKYTTTRGGGGYARSISRAAGGYKRYPDEFFDEQMGLICLPKLPQSLPWAKT